MRFLKKYFQAHKQLYIILTSCGLPLTLNNLTLAFPFPNTTLVFLPSANYIVCVLVSKSLSKLTNFVRSVIMWLVAPVFTSRLESSSRLLLRSLVSCSVNANVSILKFFAHRLSDNQRQASAVQGLEQFGKGIRIVRRI